MLESLHRVARSIPSGDQTRPRIQYPAPEPSLLDLGTKVRDGGQVLCPFTQSTHITVHVRARSHSQGAGRYVRFELREGVLSNYQTTSDVGVHSIALEKELEGRGYVTREFIA